MGLEAVSLTSMFLVIALFGTDLTEKNVLLLFSFSEKRFCWIDMSL